MRRQEIATNRQEIARLETDSAEAKLRFFVSKPLTQTALMQEQKQKLLRRSPAESAAAASKVLKRGHGVKVKYTSWVARAIRRIKTDGRSSQHA